MTRKIKLYSNEKRIEQFDKYLNKPDFWVLKGDDLMISVNFLKNHCSFYTKSFLDESKDDIGKPSTAFVKDEEDREPPPFIYAYKNKKLICIGVTEYWVNCGGKQPYSDSYTISIYTKNDLSSQLQRECFKLCKESGIEIKEIIDSPNHYYKEKESLLKKYCPLEKRC